MLYFKDISVGDEFSCLGEYRVTEEEIIEVGRRWDPQPFHIDPVAAANSTFGGLVASSAHIFSIWVCLGHAEEDKDKAIGGAVSALGFNNLQWHSPVRPNDVLKRSQTIIELRESNSKPGLYVLRVAETVFNQRNETVFTLECASLHKKVPGDE